MKKIPFNVSARTAKLMGRENVANVDGAIIELVKNTYDANANICFILIDNKYIEIPKKLKNSEIENIIKYNIVSKFTELKLKYFFNKFYTLNNDEYTLNHNIEDKYHDKLNKFFKSLCTIHIIDNGEGMSWKTIKDNWMTIGTDNKELNFKIANRVKSGSKGIGRLSLDRLGEKSLMMTKSKSNIFYRWKIDWKQFEQRGKNINEINAEVSCEKKFNFQSKVKLILKKFDINTEDIMNSENIVNNFETGTILKISNLRDDWNDDLIKKLSSNLKLLIPAKEENFKIILLSNMISDNNDYGEIESTMCDDYDYKLEAKSDENGNIEIKIFRNEIDLNRLDKSLFEFDKMQNFPYDENTFFNGNYFISNKTNLSQLMVGLEEKVLQNIGKFSFTLYFMKNSYSDEDREKFFYKEFLFKNRREWLKNFGGIKLFRDNFRVRPYGEIGSDSFDWLGLGDRQATSPAGISRGSGWRVRPNQVYGVIEISRLSNLNFEDKSNREGLQENSTFTLFKEIIKSIIKEFEDDRSHIAFYLNELYKQNNQIEATVERAKEVAKKIAKKKLKDKNEDEDTIALAKGFLYREQYIEDLKNELKMLRVLASSGLVISAFAHEFGELNKNITIRNENLNNILNDVFDKENINISNIEDFLNPFIILDDMKNDDEKLKSWLDFVINSIKKDRRKRKKLNLVDYLKRLKDIWFKSLETKVSNLEITCLVNEANIRCFEIDFDTIFNNLIINSLDSFMRKNFSGERVVYIKLNIFENQIIIDYSDSGLGLETNIVDENKIFEPFFTTKLKKQTGERDGVGLGMWLVKSTIEDYGGNIEVVSKQPIKFKITFPIKYNKRS